MAAHAADEERDGACYAAGSADHPLAMLRIRVPDLRYVTDLLAFLRERGCIAYTAGDGIVKALLPDVPWREEEARIRAAVADWVELRPELSSIEIEPIDA